MISYSEHISFDVEKTKEAITRDLQTVAKNVSVSGDEIVIRRHNSFLHLLAPTGKINIRLSSNAENGKTNLACEVLPSIFTFKAAMGFTILSIVVWALIFWFFPLNIYMAVGFVLHWIVMCFVALYLLVGFMAILTVMLLIYNFNDFPIQYVLVAWIVTFLITHLTLRYNRSSLKQYLLAMINSINSDKK